MPLQRHNGGTFDIFKSTDTMREKGGIDHWKQVAILLELVGRFAIMRDLNVVSALLFHMA
jgi:hypothetical protein